MNAEPGESSISDDDVFNTLSPQNQSELGDFLLLISQLMGEIEPPSWALMNGPASEFSRLSQVRDTLWEFIGYAAAVPISSAVTEAIRVASDIAQQIAQSLADATTELAPLMNAAPGGWAMTPLMALLAQKNSESLPVQDARRHLRFALRYSHEAMPRIRDVAFKLKNADSTPLPAPDDDSYTEFYFKSEWQTAFAAAGRPASERTITRVFGEHQNRVRRDGQRIALAKSLIAELGVSVPTRESGQN